MLLCKKDHLFERTKITKYSKAKNHLNENIIIIAQICIYSLYYDKCIVYHFKNDKARLMVSLRNESVL